MYVVINGRNKINEDKYSLSTSVLKGEISLDNNNITFEKFFDPKEIIVGSTDFSHSGGRIAKYKNNNFLLTVPDHALMDDYNLLIEKINSKDSIIGKILMINKKILKFFHMDIEIHKDYFMIKLMTSYLKLNMALQVVMKLT